MFELIQVNQAPRFVTETCPDNTVQISGWHARRNAPNVRKTLTALAASPFTTWLFGVRPFCVRLETRRHTTVYWETHLEEQVAHDKHQRTLLAAYFQRVDFKQSRIFNLLLYILSVLSFWFFSLIISYSVKLSSVLCPHWSYVKIISSQLLRYFFQRYGQCKKF